MPMPLDSFDLDSPCGRHFKYRDFIECSKTWKRLSAEGDPRIATLNLPQERATLEGIDALCERVLDPVCERFGLVELTYGFASPAFVRRVPRGIAPALDQHAGSERTRTGALRCSRGGQAVDLLGDPDKIAEIARYVALDLPFDRLYYFGPGRPFHVSVGPQNTKQITRLCVAPSGRIYPRRGTASEIL